MFDQNIHPTVARVLVSGILTSADQSTHADNRTPPSDSEGNAGTDKEMQGKCRDGEMQGRNAGTDGDEMQGDEMQGQGRNAGTDGSVTILIRVCPQVTQRAGGFSTAHL